MLTVKEAIERRRSVRRYRPDPVPEEFVRQILEAARLAPSGSNSQPWRFIAVTDAEERQRLRMAANGQKFIEEAPVVFICCADLDAYSQQSRQQRRQEFIDYGVFAEFGIAQGMTEEQYRTLRSQVINLPLDVAYQSGRFNVAIAVQNMVLMATALGLGSCWIGAMDGLAIHEMYQLPDNIRVVVLLTVGYPAHEPPPRPRLPLDKIWLKPVVKVERQ